MASKKKNKKNKNKHQKQPVPKVKQHLKDVEASGKPDSSEEAEKIFQEDLPVAEGERETDIEEPKISSHAETDVNRDENDFQKELELMWAFYEQVKEIPSTHGHVCS